MTFWQNKKVFITGHTGFKGMWLSKMLLLSGAKVTGYALTPEGENARLFEKLGLTKEINNVFGDVRDYEKLSKTMSEAKSEIVLHLAAQPIVLESYKRPRYTYETNVMGTVNVLECIRSLGSVRSFLNVTTDKVYLNHERAEGYTEDEILDGFDPYSNSKSCSELVTHSYKNSFFAQSEAAISTARAGNVIGGGDFSPDRIIPDCVRAALSKKVIEVRNPNSVRPYQHVLEPLNAYLLIAKEQYVDKSKEGWYNVGPDDCDCVTTGELCDIFCRAWGEGASWKNVSVDNPHEANFLKLNSTKIKNALGWRPRVNIKKAVEMTVEWSKAYANGEDISLFTQKQIEEYDNI